MGLLDFLFDNVFVLVFLFWVVSFLLRKIRGAGTQAKPARQNRMPTYGNGPAEENGPFEVPQSPERSRHTQKEYAFVLKEAGEALTAEEPLRTAARKAPVVEQAVAERRSAKHRRSFHVDPNHAVQGMIWSEVYGPPRALKPFATRRRWNG